MENPVVFMAVFAGGVALAAAVIGAVSEEMRPAAVLVLKGTAVLFAGWLLLAIALAVL